MDVMRPDLLWIGDRCYRLPFQDPLNPEEDDLNTENVEWTETEPNCDDDEDDEESDLELLIETLASDRYKLNLPISQAFWSKLVGFKGVTKKRIESDTRTTISVPKPMEHDDVIIKGSSKKDIILAKKIIDDIVLSSRSKLMFTHFISIPMKSAEIKKNFIAFKDQVLKSFSRDRGIDESIFQNPDKLHLTIATLALTDQSERKLAERRLNEVYENIRPLFAKKGSCNINVKGIEYMNDDPAEVDVLYGKIDPQSDSDFIQKIADSILKHFSHHKLIKSESREQVKLHITLMNTLFRDEELEEVNEETGNFNKNKSYKKKRRTFNAVNILSKFQDYYFGSQELKTIELSVRYSTAEDGYYKSSCVIDLLNP